MSSRVISCEIYWWRWAGSNGRPAAYESAALPTELHRHTKEINGLRRRSQGRFAHCARTQKNASCSSAKKTNAGTSLSRPRVRSICSGLYRHALSASEPRNR